MLDSKQLIEITGISRATLNNYVAMGILPSPEVRPPQGGSSRATRLGYFADEAVDIIQQVQQLKKEGLSMAQIAEQIGSQRAAGHDEMEAKAAHSSATPPHSSAQAPIHASNYSDKNSASSSVGEQGSLASLSFDQDIESLPGPAYMVNNNMELIWWNENAETAFFTADSELPRDLESRNLLQLLFASPLARDEQQLIELLKPHIASGKKRLSQQALFKVYSALDAHQHSLLKQCFDLVDSVGKEPMLHFPAMLTTDSKGESHPEPYDLYVCFYREGILFTYSPVQLSDDYLLDFLSKRNHVINELLKRRKPHLTNVTVMVADVQNSTRICSELPAEEYFELINSIWQRSEPIFRKYYGTYGKHAGDGMVYYFFPQPDCDYKLNAIQCSLELQALMKTITLEWQARKGWFNDIFLNIGLNEGQEWFGSYHAGGHVEFTVLGETINYASRISDFARNGSIWATKTMLNQLPALVRQKVSFGISRKTHNQESVFVTDTYANIGSMLDENQAGNKKFKEVEMLPITEVRSIEM